MSNPALSIVIPAYNEATRIGNTLESIVRYFSRNDTEFEVIVVDDGSTDGTPHIVESWAPKIKNLTLIVNEKNRGKGFSVKRGMLAATGDYRLFMDADNSVDISHLDTFSPWLEKGFDIVIGSIHMPDAVIQEKSGWHKRLLGRLSRDLIHVVTQLKVRDTQRGFKLFSSRAVNTIFPLQTIDRFGFDIELLVIARTNGFSIKELPVSWVNPAGSKVTLGSYAHTLMELFLITRNRVLGKYLRNFEKERRFAVKKLINSYNLRRINLWVIFYLIVYLILIIKLITIQQIDNGILFATYSIAVSLYILSRFGLAYFHEPSVPDSDVLYEPTISFAVPSKNEGENIRETILKISDVNYPHIKFNIIAINDGSDDNTLDEMLVAKDIVEGRSEVLVKVIDWKINKGKREGMAECVRLSDKDIVIFIDSDSFVDPEAARELVKYFVHEDVAAVAGHAYVANAEVNSLTKMQAVRYFVAFKAYKAAESLFGAVTCCSGCCSAYRRSYMNEVMDEWLAQKFLGVQCTYGDDRSLTNYLLKKGYKTLFSSRAIAYTFVPETLRKFMKQQFRWKKSWVRESLIAGSFMWKKNPIMSISFYLGVLLPLFAPIIVVRALVWYPYATGHWPFYYLFGLVLMAIVYGLYYYIYTKDRKWVYGVLFAAFYTIILIWQLPWAILNLRDARWGTR